MSSSGEYSSLDGQQVFGTPVRVAELLSEAASRYPGKNIYAVFNDINADKIEHLQSIVSSGTKNYHISFHNKDCNQLINHNQVSSRMEMQEILYCLVPVLQQN